MPSKRGLAYLLPFEDPDFVPEHPIHHQKPIEQDPYDPLRKGELKRLEAEQLQKDLENWQIPHVVQSWEVDALRAKKHKEVLSFQLNNGTVDQALALRQSQEQFELRTSKNDSSATRGSRSPHDPNKDVDHTDFRQFAVHSLRLGYHRFHLSTEEEPDPNIPEPDICWIMEYTEHECNIIRRQIARIIGVYPAVTDSETKAYDYEIAFRYDRRMQARCCMGNKRCVRPSHIRIVTTGGRLIP